MSTRTSSKSGAGFGGAGVPPQEAYFARHYEDVRLPIGHGDDRGLRRGQLGAVHAIAAHFTLRSDPAVVTMPTGSGKTTVLVLTSFLLCARRVLVVTPSRLVRHQIAREFATLERVRAIGALPDAIEPPTVRDIESRLTSTSDWEALRDVDVVVATPACVSPGILGVAPPPEDLFDVVLVDEAHHSPARTWRAILDTFLEAKRLLVTATPFRRDRREIAGRFIYEYPIRQAYDDGVFGSIDFHSVAPTSDVSNDVAIAREAAAVIASDRANGLKHALMVRTDLRARAKELEEVYARETTLRLRTISSTHSLRHVTTTIAALRAGELDGILCVDMLGEGFDFPHLKVAAIHAPHKSLAATLQFIGRFARTNASDIGRATFLAVPAEIQLEAERLYDEGAQWQHIVPKLSEMRVGREVAARETLQTFRPAESTDDEASDLSLYSLRPFCHAKVFRVPADLDLDRDLVPPPGLDVVLRTYSEEHRCLLLITREAVGQRWISVDRFRRTDYDLFILYQDPATKLVFICASRRTTALYDHFIEQLASDAARLGLGDTERVFRGLDGFEMFSVGMRSRAATSRTESYRILTGPSADRAIRPTDGFLFNRGHGFGRGRQSDGAFVTVGASSSSKVWSQQYLQIPDLLSWFRTIAAKLASGAPLHTNSGWDRIESSVRLTTLPPAVPIAADWHEDAYRNSPIVRIRRSGGLQEWPLVEAELRPIPTACSEEAYTGVLAIGEVERRFVFTLEEGLVLEDVPDNDTTIDLLDGDTLTSIEDYCSEHPPKFYLADFSAVQGEDHLRASTPTLIDASDVVRIDWRGQRVSINDEKGDLGDGFRSIHGYLRDRLSGDAPDLLVYDDGSGEVADFVSAVATDAGIIRLTLFHVKATKEAAPGHRVEDLYEVVGQALKSARWANPPALLKRLLERDKKRATSRVLIGGRDTLRALGERALTSRTAATLVIVQPGLLAEGMTSPIRQLLGGTRDYLIETGTFDEVVVWCS